MKIVSCTAGRLRLRGRSWSAANLAALKEKIQQLKGVKQIEINPQTKSILVFHQANLPHLPAQILQLAQKIKPTDFVDSKLSNFKITTRKKQNYRATINKTMLLTLGTSLLALATKNKKLHALTGVGFVGLLLLHLLEHR